MAGSETYFGTVFVFGEKISAITMESAEAPFAMMNAPGSMPLPKILCCMCGSTIDPNPANMCVQCLSSRIDITEGISTQVSAIDPYSTFALVF